MEIKRKAFVSEDLLQKWVNSQDKLNVVSITKSETGHTVWYYAKATPGGGNIGGGIKRMLGGK